MKRKVLAVLLLVSILVSSSSFNVLANAGENGAESEIAETYTDLENQYTLERVKENDKVIIYVKSLDGSIQHILTNENGIVKMDGYFVGQSYSNSLPWNASSTTLNSTRAVQWGDWSANDSGDISTGGLSVAIIGGLVAAFAPWATLKVVGVVAAAIAGKYDTLLITWQIRYGFDEQYSYYERNTWYYGDGKLITGPIMDKGKEYK